MWGTTVTTAVVATEPIVIADESFDLESVLREQAQPLLHRKRLLENHEKHAMVREYGPLTRFACALSKYAKPVFFGLATYAGVQWAQQELVPFLEELNQWKSFNLALYRVGAPSFPWQILAPIAAYVGFLHYDKLKTTAGEAEKRKEKLFGQTKFDDRGNSYDGCMEELETRLDNFHRKQEQYHRIAERCEPNSQRETIARKCLVRKHYLPLRDYISVLLLNLQDLDDLQAAVPLHRKVAAVPVTLPAQEPAYAPVVMYTSNGTPLRLVEKRSA